MQNQNYNQNPGNYNQYGAPAPQAPQQNASAQQVAPQNSTPQQGIDPDKPLTFLGTETLNEWKTRTGIQTVNIARNPKKGGSLFIIFGGKSGGLSSKIKSKSDVVSPMMSLVQLPGGEPYYLLHNEGQGGAEVVFSL